MSAFRHRPLIRPRPEAGLLPACGDSRTAAPRAQGSGPFGLRRSAIRASAPVETKSRQEMIRDAAYLRSERRGFEAGHELEDWLAAEREVDVWIETRGAPQRYSR